VHSFSAWSAHLRQRSYKKQLRCGERPLTAAFAQKSSFTAESVHGSNGKRKENIKNTKEERKRKSKRRRKGTNMNRKKKKNKKTILKNK
jgi:hypothetical protein